PLGRSLLTASVQSADEVANDRRKDHPRFSAENLARNNALVARVQEAAQRKACTPGQLALAWLLAQGEDIAVIPGTKQTARVDDNLRSVNVTLTPEEADALSRAIPPGAAAGTRYPAGGMKGVYL
ncbi:MAG: aldo/keto reductase, partial [Burkholderiaceae bacterium]